MRWTVLLAAALTTGLLIGQPAMAGGYKTVEWPALKAEIYGDREILPGDGVVVLNAPIRSPDDRRVPVSVEAQLLDGSLIRSVTLILDENPAPVSAVFDLAEPQDSVRIGADLRLNGPTPLRAVIETSDGRLLMTSRMVKTSGQGACAAPPMSNPDAAIASIGEMQAVAQGGVAGTSAPRMVRVDMKHPQHTGMQMDQITLHYILARFVDTVDVWAGERKMMTVTGSISLSEDPSISFELRDPFVQEVRIRMEDISGQVVDKTLPLGPQS